MADLSHIYNLIHSYDDAISAAKPGSPEADRLIKNQRQTIEQLPGLTSATFGSASSPMSDVASEAMSRNDGYQELHNDAIVPPSTIATAKAGKIEDNDLIKIQKLYEQGITPQTDPVRYLRALGAASDQNGLLFRTTGVPLLDHLATAFSSKRNALLKRQQALLATGQEWANANLKIQANQITAPRTMAEAESVSPGLIKPLASQGLGAPLGQNDHGPVAPYNPKAVLEPFQREIASGAVNALGAGHLMRDEAGNAVPTNYMNIQGRKIDPAGQAQYFNTLEAAGIVPPGTATKIAAVSSEPLAPTILNSLGREITQGHTEKGKGLLSQDIRDVLAANGQEPTPTNVAAARDTLKQEKAAVAEQEHFNRAGSDIQQGMAVQKYKKLYGKLSKSEKEDVDRMAGQYAAQQAAYHTASVIQTANETTPLNEKAFLYINDKGEKATAGMTHPQAIKAGFIPVPQSAIDAVGAANASKHIIGEYKDVIKKVLVKSTGNSAIDFAKVNLNRVGAWIKDHAGDPDVQQLEALNSNLSTYSKAFMDSGNVGMGEQIMKLKALPSWGSTVESGMAKLTLMERMLNSIIKSRGIPIDTSHDVYNKPSPQAAPQAPKAPQKSPEARFNELQKSGMKEADIYKKLHQEGYR